MKINLTNTRFLKRDEDVKHKDIVTIASEGKWGPSMNFKKEDGTPSSQFDISFTLANGENRTTNINGANVRLLGSAFGDETTNWIGKEVRAWKTKSEKAKGGFTFLYVPTDWSRDDTGEWIKPEGYTPVVEVAKEDDAIEYPTDDINPEDIPF